MKNLITRRVAAFDRVIEFGTKYPLTPAIALVTTLNTQLASIAALVRDHASNQAGGLGDFLGGTINRQLQAEELLGEMRPVNQIARALDPQQYPEARRKFRLKYRGGYEGLIALSQAYLDALPTMKAVFVEHGLPADFDELIQEKQTALLASTQRRDSGLCTQVGGTAGMEAESSNGMRVIRRLDAILSNRYQSDPALLAAWKVACHVERSPQRSAGEEPATAPAPSPAPSGAPTPTA